MFFAKPMLENLNNTLVPELFDRISEIIVDARKWVVQIINNELIVTYWAIGKEIVERERINNIDNQTSRQIILQQSKTTYRKAWQWLFSFQSV